MELSIICFTRYGYELGTKVLERYENGSSKLPVSGMRLFCKSASLREIAAAESSEAGFVEESVEDWAKEEMRRKHALLFIGAAGIALRAVASSVVSKLTDPPVLVMDDTGRFVIPLLSGHLGGANELAHSLGNLIGAIPVITTSTDNHKVFAIDLFAKENGLYFTDRSSIAAISGKILAGGQAILVTEDDIYAESAFASGAVLMSFRKWMEEKGPVDVWIGRGDVPKEMAEGERTIHCLRPVSVILGIGCKKGKTKEEIRKEVLYCLTEAGLSREDLCGIASIDVKKEEEGILALAEEWKLPFVTFSAEELNRVEGSFHESSFVKETVGVGCVCERAAACACGEGYRMIFPKRAVNGVTLALAEKKWSIKLHESRE